MKIVRSTTLKLYLNASQDRTLDSWRHECCRLHNRALEHRKKAYARRGESVSYYDQQKLLTAWRGRMPTVAAVPAQFERDALRRVDRSFIAFFRRCKAGEKKKGFPRFRSHQQYQSMEQLQPGNFYRGSKVFVPGLGLVIARGQVVVGKQIGLRVINRPSGWYAQILVEGPADQPPCDPKKSVGIDVGLTSFATLSTGEKIENPRFYRKSERRLKRSSQRVSRRQKGSANRRKAVKRLAREHERIAAQRRDFAHQESRKLVDRFDLIGFEKLNIAGLARTRLAKSIMDAAWGMFLFFVTYKAANAGRHAVAVDPRGTSQECPWCGAIKKKSLSERRHECPCRTGSIDRDHASGLVIESRALAIAGALYLRRATPILPLEQTEASGLCEKGSLISASTQ